VNLPFQNHRSASKNGEQMQSEVNRKARVRRSMNGPKQKGLGGDRCVWEEGDGEKRGKWKER